MLWPDFIEFCEFIPHYWRVIHVTSINYESTVISPACLQGIVRTLQASDAQLFSGWGQYPCINDSDILNTLDQLAHTAARLLKVCGSN